MKIDFSDTKVQIVIFVLVAVIVAAFLFFNKSTQPKTTTPPNTNTTPPKTNTTPPKTNTTPPNTNTPNPTCKPGYSNTGNRCIGKCPDGYNQFGLDPYMCTKPKTTQTLYYEAKDVYDLYNSPLPTCKPGYTKTGGKCVGSCPDGYQPIDEDPYNCIKYSGDSLIRTVDFQPKNMYNLY